MKVKLEVWGEFALFTRPETKMERVSYEVMTPSAAAGILKAIYWKPEMDWRVEEIHVLAPIRFLKIVRNEVSSSAKLNATEHFMDVTGHRVQRSARVLCDVRYGIVASVEVVSPVFIRACC